MDAGVHPPEIGTNPLLADEKYPTPHASSPTFVAELLADGLAEAS